MLSAETRNGATLKLKVGAVGYFSDENIQQITVPSIVEENVSD
jgi:hypothetical protein